MTPEELRDIFPSPRDEALYCAGAGVDMRDPDEARKHLRLLAEAMWRYLANDTKPSWRVRLVAEPVTFPARAADAPPWGPCSESLHRLADLAKKAHD